MKILHLTSSRCFGGPERQMLELAFALRPNCDSAFASFSEDGLCSSFLACAADAAFEATEIAHDMPHLIAAERDLRALLKNSGAEVLLCHGYKAGMIGLLAARRLGIPVVAVSRGWTGETCRVRLYESLDRRVLRHMDRIVCVSQAQAAKVRRAGVRDDRIAVIPNAIRPERFDPRNAARRRILEALLSRVPRLLVGAAGRLSPEKGFEVLVDAAATIVRSRPDTGFVLFGDGPLRESLQARIITRGLASAFVLAGFRNDLDELMPQFDVFTLPSFTEGLPNVVLEAMAARVPVVATAVGGTPEVLEDGIGGYLVPAGDPSALAARLAELLGNERLRREMASAGQDRVRESFSFESQAAAYLQLFGEMGLGSAHKDTPLVASR